MHFQKGVTPLTTTRPATDTVRESLPKKPKLHPKTSSGTTPIGAKIPHQPRARRTSGSRRNANGEPPNKGGLASIVSNRSLG